MLVPCYACRPAAVGLADQWVHQRLSKQHYEQWYAELRQMVLAHDINNVAHQMHKDGMLIQLQCQPVIIADRDYR